MSSSERKEGPFDALRARITELTTDIGCVLHANTATLFMVHQAVDVALHVLRPNPFGAGRLPSAEEIQAALDEPLRDTLSAVRKLLGILEDAGRRDALDSPLIEELRHYVPTLEDVETYLPIEESRTSALRTISCRIQDIGQAVVPGKLPREALRHLLRSAASIERLTAIVTLLQTRAAVLQMDYTIRSLREFITADLRQQEKPRHVRLATLVEAAHKQLVEYAHSSGVKIIPQNEAEDAEVHGVERELVRAFANLLHNALKYSWRRDRSEPPWVSIRTFRDARHVCVTFENWGVPISADELETGLVFELGYRGKWSTDRGRLGTGIGLTDAREVVRRHAGDVMVESAPARSWERDRPESEEYYRQPFLTRITVRLPES